MDRSTFARTGIAGTVAAMGLAVGGIAMASAESDTTDAVAGAAAATMHPGGHGRGGGHVAEALAEQLGLEEGVVREALVAVRDELGPDRGGAAPRTAPTDEERAERRAAFAAALAEELEVSEAKVTAALAALAAEGEADLEERRADIRERLVERLDAAIEDGTLDASDKASVLKAFDADLLGGGPGGRGPGGAGPRG